MKCKKCGATMEKRAEEKEENVYYFVCPKCGNEVGRKSK